MNASSTGLVAAALAALLSIDSSTAAVVIARQPHVAPHERVSREFRPTRIGERALHDESARLRRDRRRFPGDWLAGGAELPDFADLGAETPASAFFEGPSTNITITMAAPNDARDAAPANWLSGGPRIITVGARPRSARWAKTPIVVYGRAPAGQAD
jgi:hypothetical protein